MFRSLLVPLDGSGFSEHSLPLAEKVARLTGASLHLAHVHTPYEPDQLLFTTPFQFEQVDLAEYDAHHRDEEESYLAAVANRVASDGATVDTKMLEGTEVVGELIDYANSVATDMIVMTSHGRAGVRRLWLGSVADEMIRRTTLPLIVIHPDSRGIISAFGMSVRHILVPLDGSELAESVLGPASELAHATGARMTLAQVLSPRESIGEASAVAGAGYADTGPDDAVRYLEETAKPLREEGLEVATYITAGIAPALGLARAVDELDVDLVALATRGNGNFKRSVLGSVADQLLRSTSTPILVARGSRAA
jgi:nucleotide-binding universal stress UspA family protein